MTAGDLDSRVRLEAFHFLDEQRRIHGEEVPHTVLREGFLFRGERVPLWSPQGIFKPAILPEIPLTIRTAPDGPYDDEFEEDGYLRYRYRGTDPMHRDNVGLRLAMARQTPLVHLFGTARGWYWPRYPVFIVGDDRGGLAFRVAFDEAIGRAATPEAPGPPDARRLYVTRQTRQRLHQQIFRARVLQAYQVRCAVCRLRHRQLLEAAHIIPDTDPRGEPIVPNGLAMCRLHHGAFDGHLLGIRPDLVIELRRDLRDEEDGPMLVHGLQGFHDERIDVPRRDDLRPRREFLEQRYALFREAG